MSFLLPLGSIAFSSSHACLLHRIITGHPIKLERQADICRNELLTNLHADLQPHNTKLDKLMKEYQKLDLERHTLISDWEKGMEASGNDPKEVVNGMQAKVDGVMIGESSAPFPHSQEPGVAISTGAILKTLGSLYTDMIR